jgi:hypothetical protein
MKGNHAMSVTPANAHFNEEEHPVFVGAFGEETRRALLEEDSFAWRSVCTVLITIVVVGLLLGIFAVVIAI